MFTCNIWNSALDPRITSPKPISSGFLTYRINLYWRYTKGKNVKEYISETEPEAYWSDETGVSFIFYPVWTDVIFVEFPDSSLMISPF